MQVALAFSLGALFIDFLSKKINAKFYFICFILLVRMFNLEINAFFSKRFISGIKIVNTPPSVPTKETSGQTPKLQQSGSSRDLRRDKLRNIPGACTAYVCDQSPPRIVKTPKSQRTAGKQDKNYSMNTSTDSVRHEGAYRNRSKSGEILNAGPNRWFYHHFLYGLFSVFRITF